MLLSKLLVAFFAVYLVALALVPVKILQMVLDCFTTAVGLTVIVGYVRHAWEAGSERHPTSEAVMIVGIAAVATGYGGLRVMRMVWTEFGIAGWIHDSWAFGVLTVMLLYGATCHLLARGNAARGLVGGALALGCVLTVVVFLVRGQ